MASDFRRALELEIARKVDAVELEVAKEGALAVYEFIISAWPVDTAWSLANHRVNISGTDVLALEPSTRPETSGALLGKAASVHAQQMSKIKSMGLLKRGDREIVFGNAVPYAADVQFNPGLGERIYADAADVGRAQVRGLIASGKFRG